MIPNNKIINDMTGLQFSSVWENIGLSSLQETLALLGGTTGYHNDVLTIKSRFQSSGMGGEFRFPFVYRSHQIQLLVRQRTKTLSCQGTCRSQGASACCPPANAEVTGLSSVHLYFMCNYHWHYNLPNAWYTFT